MSQADKAKKISVALCTYNGKQYIREQLKSIEKQKHLPYEIIVGDDGSTDGTVDIIKEFSKSSPLNIQVHENKKNLGFAKNFLNTAKKCSGDWVAFCDQDDVWLPNKILNAYKLIEEFPYSNLILQKAWLCNETLDEIRRIAPAKLKAGHYDRSDQYSFWVWLGFLQTVRKDFFDLWDNGELPKNYYKDHLEISHDKWTCMIANALGGIVVDDDPVAYYRRHDNAVTGNLDILSRKDRIRKSRRVSADHYLFLSEVAEDCSAYLEKLSQLAVREDWRYAFHVSSKDFLDLAEIQRSRANIYTCQNLSGQLRAFFQVALAGGYFGRPAVARGVLSAGKDFARIISGTRE